MSEKYKMFPFFEDSSVGSKTDPRSVISSNIMIVALQEPCVPATCFPFHFPRSGMKKVLIAAWHLNSLKGYYNTRGGGTEISHISHWSAFVEAGYPMLGRKNTPVNWQSLSPPEG